jgi:hypothetical protein
MEKLSSNIVRLVCISGEYRYTVFGNKIRIQTFTCNEALSPEDVEHLRTGNMSMFDIDDSPDEVA